MKQRFAVSACLLGVPCRYDGNCAPNEAVRARAVREGWIPICPEILGGLPTPRCPAERLGDRVVTKDGGDVTEAFVCGAEEALKLCKLYGVTAAVLKERSPSCGHGVIYDGTFTGTHVQGDGVTALLFAENGIRVYGESEIEDC